jgi:MFS family permease
MTAYTPDGASPATDRERRRVILAAALGTTFEWYAFFLYGSLLLTIASNFFGDLPENARNVCALLAFAVGFVVKPVGALLFGRISDQMGRKYPFMTTILIMGASTFLVGVLPTSQTIGIAAAILLILLRCMQGLALGGESGGAAIFVAEYAPRHRRGLYTSFVQLSAALGLVLSLVAIHVTSWLLGAEAFEAWGWRLPFLMSIVLVGFSLWIRLHLRETPVFLKMKAEGRQTRAPVREAFGNRRNGRVAVVALFGLVAGAAVVTYTGLFYPLFFLGSVLKVDPSTVGMLAIWALLLGSGGFLVFGWLSDRVGRKPIVLGGCLLAALTYFPLFQMISAQANPDLHRAHRTIPVQVVTDTAACSFQFNPTGMALFYQPCDIAKMALGYQSVNYTVEHDPGREIAAVRIAGRPLISADSPTFARDLRRALTEAGYPAAWNLSVVRMAHPFDLFEARTLALIGLLTVLVLYVAMVFGPVAAALVELFPTRIRYTGMSLPYQIGNGWFGGLLPATVLAINAETGGVYSGLWYPVVIALATAAIGLVFVPETKDRDITAEAPEAPMAWNGGLPAAATPVEPVHRAPDPKWG